MFRSVHSSNSTFQRKTECLLPTPNTVLSRMKHRFVWVCGTYVSIYCYWRLLPSTGNNSCGQRGARIERIGTNFTSADRLWLTDARRVYLLRPLSTKDDLSRVSRQLRVKINNYFFLFPIRIRSTRPSTVLQLDLYRTRARSGRRQRKIQNFSAIARRLEQIYFVWFSLTGFDWRLIGSTGAHFRYGWKQQHGGNGAAWKPKP